MDDHELLKQFIVELKADRDAAKAKEHRDSWTTIAGVSLVFIAVLAAIATQWGAKYSARTMTALNDATYAQTLASDQWNFYQAKSIKENLYEVSKDEEEANPSDQTPKIIGMFTAKAASLANDKLAIKAAAEKFDHDRQAARDAAHGWSVKGSAMGLAVSAYQLAIAIASVGMLMKKKGFWYASLLMAAGATVQMLLTWLS
jgi:hypothetical protein